jgi:membrane protein DedA with SNARE-associated domain
MYEFINIILEFSQSIGYWGIILLMTIESSFIPFPSEIIIPPAAYLAALGEFNIFLVILSGVIGSLIGALINYFLALKIGRKIVYSLVDKKFFKFLLLNSKKVKIAEKYFYKHGNISTLLGRFIPGIRQLISIPAGFAKMNLKYFCLFTGIGSAVWVIILAVLGYFFGANKEIFILYYKEASILAILFSVIALFFYYSYQKKKKSNLSRK